MKRKLEDLASCCSGVGSLESSSSGTEEVGVGDSWSYLGGFSMILCLLENGADTVCSLGDLTVGLGDTCFRS